MDALSQASRIPRNANFPSINAAVNNVEYGEAYYEAAQILWENAPKDDKVIPIPDTLVFPVLHLVHHFLELELKEAIRLTYSIGTMTGKANVCAPPLGHDLEMLLSFVDSNRAILCLDDPISKESRDIIADLEKFSSKGEALRYPSTKSNKPTLPRVSAVNIPMVMDIITEKTNGELAGFIGYLMNWEDTIEMAHESFN